MTLGELKAKIGNWMRERVEDDLLTDASNDAIESLWQSIIQVRLETFMNGPVNISIAAASERIQLVSVPDPTIQLVLSNQAVGSALPQTNLVFAFTLVTESGSETMLSPTLAFLRTAGSVVQVNAPAFVNGAIGYNVYAGSAVGKLARQNDDPLDFQFNWTEPKDTGVIDAPDLPSPPSANSTGDNIFMIEHIEVQTPDQTWKPWNCADLDSIIMRSCGRTIATSSLYQNYMWDLIGMTTLEIRPQTGVGLVPRYFYVQKPRRLRFDSSTIPFVSIPNEAFLRYFAIGLLKLAAEEYQASQGWFGQAETERMTILRTVGKIGGNRNDRITPYMV